MFKGIAQKAVIMYLVIIIALLAMRIVHLHHCREPAKSGYKTKNSYKRFILRPRYNRA